MHMVQYNHIILSVSGAAALMLMPVASVRAQAPPTPVFSFQSGGTPTAQNLTVYDNNGQNVTIGLLNQTAHFFTPANVLALSGGTLTGGISVSPTGGYWSSGQGPAAVIHRFNDRVFVGQATNYTGDYNDTNETWVSTTGKTIYSYLERNAQFYVNSSYSEMGGFFASRTGDSAKLPGNAASNCCSIALAAMGLNDNTSTAQPAWDLYLTAVRLPGTGHMINEIDVLNATSTLTRGSAYSFDTTGLTAGLWVMAGGEGSPYNVPPGYPAGTTPYPNTSPSTVGLYIGTNGTLWDKGIIIANNSLNTQADGTTLDAIEMANNMRITWAFDNSGSLGGFISSENTSAAAAMGMSFTQFGTVFWDPTRIHPYFSIAVVPNAVNFPVVTAATSGNTVKFSASGTDNNIGVEIIPSGAAGIYLDGPVFMSGQFRATLATPASSTAACITGQVSDDASYHYLCAATNTWRRIAYSTSRF